MKPPMLHTATLLPILWCLSVSSSNLKILITGGEREIDSNTVDRDSLVQPIRLWAAEELPTLSSLLPNLTVRFETVELKLSQPFVTDLTVDREENLKAQLTRYGAFIYFPGIVGRLLAAFSKDETETGHMRANITTGMVRIKHRGALPPFGEIRCDVSQIRVDSGFVSENGWLYRQLARLVDEKLENHVEAAICDRLREGMKTVLRQKRSREERSFSLLLNYTFSRLDLAYTVQNAIADRSNGFSMIELEGQFSTDDPRTSVPAFEHFSFRLPDLTDAAPRHNPHLAMYAVSDHLINSFCHLLHYAREFWFFLDGADAADLCSGRQCLDDIFSDVSKWLEEASTLEMLIRTKDVPTVTTTTDDSSIVVPFVFNIYKRHPTTKQSDLLFQLASDFHYRLIWTVNETSTLWADYNPKKSIALTCEHQLKSFEVSLPTLGKGLQRNALTPTAPVAYHELFEKVARSIIGPHLTKVCQLGIPLPLPKSIKEPISASAHHGYPHVVSVVAQTNSDD